MIRELTYDEIHPQEVRIAFENSISAQYEVRARPNDPAAGNGVHSYGIVARDTEGKIDWATEVHFQKGPLPQVGHNGILSNVLLGILIHHLQAFQEGEYKSRETACAITALQEAEAWLARRADKRQAQGILGQHAKEK